MNKPKYKCLTKATTDEFDQFKFGSLQVFDTHLKFRDWNIQYDEIKNATLYSFKEMLFIPGYILKIETENKCYHFGLNGNEFWGNDLPFTTQREKGMPLNVKREKTKKKILVISLLLISYLVYVFAIK